MNQDEWQQVKEIFHQARELAPEKRAEFLDEVCDGNDELREQIEILLESYESDFLEETAIHKVTEIISGSSLKIGQQIGHYEIKEILGTGGMGEVFLAEDTELKRPVAVKILHAEVAADQERISRFIREARAASALNHPNILTIHEIGNFEDSRFIVSEYVKGKTLREKLKEKNLTLAESLEIASQIAVALEAAHEAGIVHRDIKPENIMLRNDGLVKVLDFGLAKLVRSKEWGSKEKESSTLEMSSSPPTPHSPLPTLTNPGVVMGTVAYMSPEQARGVAVDARTDIWSLGVVLYEILSGKLPFPGETTSDIIASILKTEVEPLENLNKEIPPEIEAICFKALTKNVNERYQTAQELLQDLREAKKNLENANEQTATKQFNYSDERKTELIRHRPTLSKEYLVSQVKQHKLGFSVLLGILILTLGIGTGSYWLVSKNSPNPNATSNNAENPLSKMKLSRLTTTGEEVDAAISPDGKYVAHLNNHEGKQSIIIRQVATGSSNTIVNPVEQTTFSGLTFSPDGDFLFYTANALNKETNKISANIFRIPILGGNPTPVFIENPASILSFAPDGNKIAYLQKDVSSARSKDVNLQITSLDEVLKGKFEPKTLAAIRYPENSEPFVSWSPDGSTIACIITNLGLGTQGYRIIGINTETGERKDLTKQNWKWISSLVWHKNTGDLFITGNQTADEANQIWRIDKEGVEHRITNDLLNYQKISISSDGSTIATIQQTVRAHIYIAENQRNNQKVLFTTDKFKQITQGVDVKNGTGGIAWTPDGRLIYQAMVNDTNWLFIMNKDGSNIRQLNFDKTIIPFGPEVTSDGQYVVFINWGNIARIWRLSLVDNSIKQLTFDGQFVMDLTLTPDGKNIIYSSLSQREGKSLLGLYKIPIEGGESVDLDMRVRVPSLASDGDHLVGFHRPATGEDRILTVFSMSNPTTPLRRFSDIRFSNWVDFSWTSDSKTFLFLDPNNNYKNIKAVSINGGTPFDVTNFPDQQIFSFDLSRDGKNLAISRGSITTDVVLIKNFN